MKQSPERTFTHNGLPLRSNLEPIAAVPTSSGINFAGEIQIRLRQNKI